MYFSVDSISFVLGSESINLESYDELYNNYIHQNNILLYNNLKEPVLHENTCETSSKTIAFC